MALLPMFGFDPAPAFRPAFALCGVGSPKSLVETFLILDLALAAFDVVKVSVTSC
jgi:hypothetical protein